MCQRYANSVSNCFAQLFEDAFAPFMYCPGWRGPLQVQTQHPIAVGDNSMEFNFRKLRTGARRCILRSTKSSRLTVVKLRTHKEVNHV